jgi:hypothetical protein
MDRMWKDLGMIEDFVYAEVNDAEYQICFAYDPIEKDKKIITECFLDGVEIGYQMLSTVEQQDFESALYDQVRCLELHTEEVL